MLNSNKKKKSYMYILNSVGKKKKKKKGKGGKVQRNFRNVRYISFCGPNSFSSGTSVCHVHFFYCLHSCKLGQ